MRRKEIAFTVRDVIDSTSIENEKRRDYVISVFGSGDQRKNGLAFKVEQIRRGSALTVAERAKKRSVEEGETFSGATTTTTRISHTKAREKETVRRAQ